MHTDTARGCIYFAAEPTQKRHILAQNAKRQRVLESDDEGTAAAQNTAPAKIKAEKVHIWHCPLLPCHALVLSHVVVVQMSLEITVLAPASYSTCTLPLSEATMCRTRTRLMSPVSTSSTSAPFNATLQLIQPLAILSMQPCSRFNPRRMPVSVQATPPEGREPASRPHRGIQCLGPRATTAYHLRLLCARGLLLRPRAYCTNRSRSSCFVLPSGGTSIV